MRRFSQNHAFVMRRSTVRFRPAAPENQALSPSHKVGLFAFWAFGNDWGTTRINPVALPAFGFRHAGDHRRRYGENSQRSVCLPLQRGAPALKRAHGCRRRLLDRVDLRLVRVALRHLGVCFRSVPRMEEVSRSCIPTPRARMSPSSGRSSAFTKSCVRCARRLWESSSPRKASFRSVIVPPIARMWSRRRRRSTDLSCSS